MPLIFEVGSSVLSGGSILWMGIVTLSRLIEVVQRREAWLLCYVCVSNLAVFYIDVLSLWALLSQGQCYDYW